MLLEAWNSITTAVGAAIFSSPVPMMALGLSILTLVLTSRRDSKTQKRAATFRMLEYWNSPVVRDSRHYVSHSLRRTSCVKGKLYIGGIDARNREAQGKDAPNPELPDVESFTNRLGKIEHFFSDLTVLLQHRALDDRLAFNLFCQTTLYWLLKFEAIDYRDSEIGDLSPHAEGDMQYIRAQILPIREEWMRIDCRRYAEMDENARRRYPQI